MTQPLSQRRKRKTLVPAHAVCCVQYPDKKTKTGDRSRNRQKLISCLSGRARGAAALMRSLSALLTFLFSFFFVFFFQSSIFV